MSCKCSNIVPQTKECYNQMIVVDIPPHMREYKSNRTKEGLSDKICIDPCIIEEIQYLWKKGIVTYGSCCGHNKFESFVNVSDKDIDIMISMGYIQNHPDKDRKDTFKLKSI